MILIIVFLWKKTRNRILTRHLHFSHSIHVLRIIIIYLHFWLSLLDQPSHVSTFSTWCQKLVYISIYIYDILIINEISGRIGNRNSRTRYVLWLGHWVFAKRLQHHFRHRNRSTIIIIQLFQILLILLRIFTKIVIQLMFAIYKNVWIILIIISLHMAIVVLILHLLLKNYWIIWGICLKLLKINS